MPKVSVIMPVYNAQKYLKDAIDSILNQTFTDLEFIIINDGSSDKSTEIIESYSDPRIRYFTNKENMGIVATLNRGLELATGKYIARMDSDDISHPDRIQKQYDYMEKHPRLAVLGTNIEFIGARDGSSTAVVNPKWVKASMFFSSALAHPSVMLRGDILKRENYHYDATYEKVEDYELWTRISEKYQLNNLQETLFQYRIHAKQITQNYTDTEENSFRMLKKRELEKLNIEYSNDEFDSFVKYCFHFDELTYEDIYRLNKFCKRAYDANKKIKLYSQVALGKVMSDCITYACNVIELTVEQKRNIYRESLFVRKYFRCFSLLARKVSVLINHVC